MDFRFRTIQGLRWSFINQFIRYGSSIVFAVVLARLLQPQDFGLLAMVRVWIFFLLSLLKFGLNVLIIQDKSLTKKQISTLYWFQVLLGVAFAYLFYSFAGKIAELYQKPDIELLAKVLSGLFILSSLTNVNIALIRKKLAFKTEAKISFASVVIANIVAVLCALNGYKYWSLAILLVLKQLIRMVLSYAYVRWIPIFHFNAIFLWKSLQKGAHITGLRAINYWSKNLDIFIIGKYAGDEILGLYSKAYNFVVNPVRQFTTAVNSAMLPSFSLIQSDIIRIRRVYIEICRASSIFLLPVITIALLFAEDIVKVVLGDKWLPMLNYVYLFGVVALVQFFVRLNNSVFYAIGEHKVPLKIGVITKTVTIIAFITGYLVFEIRGLIIGYILASIIALVPEYWFLHRKINIQLTDIFQCFYKAALTITLLITSNWLLVTNLTDLNATWLYVLRILILTTEMVLSIRLWEPESISHLKSFILPESANKKSNYE